VPQRRGTSFTMDCPYSDGFDDGGRGRDARRRTHSRSGQSSTCSSNSSSVARNEIRPSSPRLRSLCDSNGSPNNSFHQKPQDNIERGSTSPTSVAAAPALYDLPTSIRPSVLRTENNSVCGKHGFVLEEDTHARHRSDFHYTKNNEWRTSEHNWKPPPRSSPGAQWSSNANTIATAVASNLWSVPPLSSRTYPLTQATSHNHPHGRSGTAYVEISPGVKVRLRGSRETKACIARDFYVPTMCSSCQLDPLFCIMDANYVVCPVCRVVQPLEGGADTEYHGGVGLGFDFDTLLLWQTEAMRQQHQRRRREQQQQQQQQMLHTW